MMPGALAPGFFLSCNQILNHMNTKKLIGKGLALLIVCGFLYLIGSLMFWSTNIAKWEGDGAMILILTAIVSVFQVLNEK